MKRIMTLVLVLVLALSMTACASEDEKAFEAANALLEAGDYEGALAGFYSIGLYNQTAEKIYEIEEHLRTEKVAFLTGAWKDLKGEITVTFGEGGRFTVDTVYGDGWEGMAWYDENDVLYILEETTIQEIDGVTHMVSESYDLVPEADFEKLGVQDVQITLDNWSEYFEVRETFSVYKDDFGETQSRGLGFGIFLKDEYVSKLKDQYSSVDVSFKVAFDQVLYAVTGDYMGGDYELGEAGGPYWFSETVVREEQSGSIYFADPEYDKDSGYSGQYAAVFTGYLVIPEEPVAYVYISEFAEVTDVVGTLTLFP